MLYLDSVPAHLRSPESALFHLMRKVLSGNQEMPDKTYREIESYLVDFFSSSVEKIDGSRIFYRARINKPEGYERLKIENMGAPPKEIARLGRAQNSGESVLYTANDYKTAIAETRPSHGNIVSVAEFSTKDHSLNIINLTKFRSIYDSSLEEFTQNLSRLTSLMRFSEKEFSSQSEDHCMGKYLDTAYISRAIRNAGFDGVSYRSLLTNCGVNYAFFNPDSLFCKKDPEEWLFSSDHLRGCSLRKIQSDS